MNAARDPYRYFRIEARELLDAMGSDLLSWSRGADEGRRVELLRHAHTLKGAARVVKQPEIARNAHELEDLLAESVGAGEAAEVAARGLALVDRMRALLEALDQAKPDTKAPSTAAVEAPRVGSTSAVRLDLGTADAFLEQVRRAGGSAARGRELTASAAAALRRIADHMERLRAGATDWSGVDEDLSGLGTSIRAVHAGLEAQSRELADLDEAISEVRLVSLQDLGKELEQLAYATAGALGKRVDLVISGAEIRVDAGIVAGLRTALRHVV